MHRAPRRHAYGGTGQCRTSPAPARRPPTGRGVPAIAGQRRLDDGGHAMNRVLTVCPFCQDPISEEPDWWHDHVATFPIGLVDYTCPGCWNTFHVDKKYVPAADL